VIDLDSRFYELNFSKNDNGTWEMGKNALQCLFSGLFGLVGWAFVKIFFVEESAGAVRWSG